MSLKPGFFEAMTSAVLAVANGRGVSAHELAASLRVLAEVAMLAGGANVAKVEVVIDEHRPQLAKAARDIFRRLGYELPPEERAS